jgi:hypothetical protein
MAWVNDVRVVQGKSGVRGIDGVWNEIYRCLFEFKLISKKSRRHNTNTWSPGLWSSRATSSGACALGLMRRGRFGRYSLSCLLHAGLIRRWHRFSSDPRFATQPLSRIRRLCPESHNRWIKSAKAVSLLARVDRGAGAALGYHAAVT